MSMVGTVTAAFCSWAVLARKWSGRSRRRTATRTGVRSFLTGMEGGLQALVGQLEVSMTVGLQVQSGSVRRR